MLKTLAVSTILGGLPGVFTSYLITGVLFHPLQRATPATWRHHEGGVQYAGAAATKLVVALSISVLVAITGGVHATGATAIGGGVMIGVLCWAAAALPALCSAGLFINLHPMVVVGLLLDWLVVTAIAGGVAGGLLIHG